MSTHTLTVAEEIADRVGVMRNGKVVFEGRVDDLRSSIPGAGRSLESLYLALMNEGSPESESARAEI
jgi:ABC-2 type transport system ATP-binding protein